MRRLGTSKLSTNLRLTIPDNFAKVAQAEVGDYFDFYQADDGTFILRIEKAGLAPKKKL